MDDIWHPTRWLYDQHAPWYETVGVALIFLFIFIVIPVVLAYFDGWWGNFQQRQARHITEQLKAERELREWMNK